ncbi:MAG: DUF615 domain-containing protein [Burkholderiales bacterium]|nr:MAG: DUF615 domain-containing protein [Burkholderiales bacterium]
MTRKQDASFIDQGPPEGAPGGAEARPSKTRRKKDMHALQALGERLVGLSAAQLATVEVPESLREAIALAQRITSREGRRRQMQYIGRLMRDADAATIAAAIERIDRPHREAVLLDRAAEQWRERLLDDEGALAEFAAANRPDDLQALRNTLRMARREVGQGRHGRHFRELFRSVRAAVGQDRPPSEPDIEHTGSKQ